MTTRKKSRRKRTENHFFLRTERGRSRPAPPSPPPPKKTPRPEKLIWPRWRVGCRRRYPRTRRRRRKPRARRRGRATSEKHETRWVAFFIFVESVFIFWFPSHPFSHVIISFVALARPGGGEGLRSLLAGNEEPLPSVQAAVRGLLPAQTALRYQAPQAGIPSSGLMSTG